MSLEDELRSVTNWRGRRLLACRAADTLDRVIEQLGRDDGSDYPPDGGTPPMPGGLRVEFHNNVANLLRMILAMNDGNTSGSRLQRY